LSTGEFEPASYKSVNRKLLIEAQT